MAQYTTRQEYRFTEAAQDAPSNAIDFGLCKCTPNSRRISSNPRQLPLLAGHWTRETQAS
jgi:hypothetical protein